MKSIVAINHDIPSVEDYLPYLSNESLRDYDIAVFNPAFPWLDRIHFNGGGSCLSVESTKSLLEAMSHWGSEFQGALQAGKTIFVVMDGYKDDLGTGGSTLTKNQRTYSTFTLNNYQFIPGNLGLKNAKGRKIVAMDGVYRGLHEAMKEIMHYRVIVNSGAAKKIYATKDGATIGAVLKFEKYRGTIVLLPYFDFDDDSFREKGEDGKPAWTRKAMKTSNALVSQLVAIDKFIRGSTERTPPPEWAEKMPAPAVVTALDQTIADLDRRIVELQQQRNQQVEAKAEVLEFSHLLYETGKPLEQAIEKALRLIGYTAETLRLGDLEIDHVIVGPSGRRMIGESEGKDNNAIDITKFRQLESNIGEDFQRDEIDEPAKGVLFGNGFRLTVPSERAEQFTQKSLINAKRLGSALIRTMDLYQAVAYLLDHPHDEAFKLACRSAIEETAGGIVQFPDPSQQ